MGAEDQEQQEVKNMLEELNGSLNKVVSHIAALESSVRRLERRQDTLLDQTQTMTSDVKDLEQEAKENVKLIPTEDCGVVSNEHVDHGEYHHHHHRQHYHHLRDLHVVATTDEVVDFSSPTRIWTDVLTADEEGQKVAALDEGYKLEAAKVGQLVFSNKHQQLGYSTTTSIVDAIDFSKLEQECIPQPPKSIAPPPVGPQNLTSDPPSSSGPKNRQ